MDKSRECILSTPFDNFLLDLGHDTAIKSVSELQKRYIRLNDSRCQLCDRLTHGLAEVVQLLRPHHPPKGFTYVGTGQPELDVCEVVGHGVLDPCKPEVHYRRVERCTLIVVRRTLTEPKTALVGVVLEPSFAGFMALIASSNKER